jgi:hypothetical protein
MQSTARKTGVYGGKKVKKQKQKQRQRKVNIKF